MVQGCIMWLPSSTCETAFHGGDVNDPYFMFDRAQQIRYRNGTWGRGDNYAGPWQWAFYYDSRALRNYNIVESRLGYETIRPALSRDEMIDIVLNDRPRDETFKPETSFEPPPPTPIGDPFGPPTVIEFHQVEFTYDITNNPDHVGGIPTKCASLGSLRLRRRGAPGQLGTSAIAPAEVARRPLRGE